MTRKLSSSLLLGVFFAAGSAPAHALYGRAAWTAQIPPGAHAAQGVAIIINERTLLIEHFTYDGTAPLVYFYLGATNTQNDFLNGIPIGPQLDRAYADETLTVTLPPGQSINGYTAISVWCVQFSVNFSSASFGAPPAVYPRAGYTADLPPGAHASQAEVTIINERILHVEHFTYDGTAPLVYFYLGAANIYNDFLNGLQVPPLLDRAYNDESLVLTLPGASTMDGYGAISVWCAAVNANFTSGPFLEPSPPAIPGDFDGDGDVDQEDFGRFQACYTGDGVAQTEPQCAGAVIDDDLDVDSGDFDIFRGCLSGPEIPGDPDCASGG
jgi:hypothetical protein